MIAILTTMGINFIQRWDCKDRINI